MTTIGPKLPLAYDVTDGISMHTHYASEIKQNLKNLLLTYPGERITDRRFGCGLQRYLFEPNTESIQAKIQPVVQDQIKRYMPFINIEQFDVTGDQNTAYVYIIFSVSAINSRDTLNLTVENTR